MGTAVTVEHSLLTDPVNDPVVTIAIPTFNRASFLKECVLSALGQSYPHFEVLVSDNASTDATQKRSSRNSLINGCGFQTKRNMGLLPIGTSVWRKLRAGTLSCVFDNDRIASHMLERMMSVIEREPQIPVVLALCDASKSGRETIWHTPKANISNRHLEGNRPTDRVP